MVRRFLRLLVSEKIGNAVNLSIVDNFQLLHHRGFFVKNVREGKVQHFYLLGSVTHSQLSANATEVSVNRQLCVVPWASVFERCTAVLARIYGVSCLYFQTYRNGISFSTQWKRKDEAQGIS